MQLKRACLQVLLGLSLAAGVALAPTVAVATPGQWTKLGKSNDWRNTRHLCALDGALYTIESGGHLYKTTPTGTWSQVGTAADWSDTVAMT